jgi:hypothetical protein
MSAQDAPLSQGRISSPRRFGVLLGVLLVAFWFLGVAPEEDWARAVVTVFAGGTLLLSFGVADMPRPRLRLAALAVAAVVAAGVAAVLVSDADSVVGGNALADAVLIALAPPAVAVGVVRTLRARGGVTIEAVFGSLCLFMFVGLLFGFAYLAVDRLGGAPFFTDGVAATPSRAVYYSFTTITTVGYGDLASRSNLGHTLSATEALVGQIYLVTVVSVIVANLAPRRQAGADAGSAVGGPSRA